MKKTTKTMTTRTYYVDSAGDLIDYQTDRRVRPATAGEERASAEAARIDGGAGVIGADELHAIISDDLAGGIARYRAMIESVGGYGATVRATTAGTAAREVVGILDEGGSGGCQPFVTEASGRRYRVDADSIRVDEPTAI